MIQNPPFQRSLILVGCFLLFSFVPLKAQQVIISEINYNPRDLLPEFIEISNITATPFDIAEWKMRGGVDYDFPAFSSASASATFLGAFEKMLLSPVDESTLRAAYPDIPTTTKIFGPWAGSLSNGGETIELKDKNGVVMCALTYDDEGLWPVSPDGTGHTLTVKNKNRLVDDWRNWQPSLSIDGSPGIDEDTVTVSTFDSDWKYYDAIEAPPSDWNQAAFNDTDWANGPSLLGFESASSPLVVATRLTKGSSANGKVSYYFRRAFDFSFLPAGARLVIDQRIDDGVVYYLNGQEIGRIRVPAGAIDHTTAASTSWEATTLEEKAVSVDISSIVETGVNVLSATVRNDFAGSSDAIFGAAIRITAKTGGAVSSVRLNEVHYDASGNIDWVEIHNSSASSAPANFSIASQNNFSDAIAFSGSIPANGFLSMNVNFPQTGTETTLFLKRASGTVADARRFVRNAAQIGFQAFPDGGDHWFGGSGNTRDAANAPLRQTDVVINEIMADPPSNLTSGEFIELYNRSAASIDLSGWKLSEAVSFDFPAGSTIPAGGYLAIAADRDHILQAYGGVNVIGNYSGKLRNDGELIRLLDANGNLADEVDYKSGGDWPVLANGDGSSMELINPDMDNSRSSAWRDSDESQKSTFKTFTHSDTYLDFADERIGNVNDYKEFHFHLVGDSHLVLKNITLQKNGAGSNILNNSAQMSPNGNGNSGWLAQGTHWQSYFSGTDFHLISDGHGDNRPNKAEIDATALNANDNITLTFDARWVSGRPRLIAQTFDHSFMQSFLIEIPENLGTPGAQNSTFKAASPPQVDAMIHSPAVPSAANNVVVTAKVASLTTPTVRLFYRQDTTAGNGAWSNLVMNDSGTSNDAAAGDGTFTGTITNQKVQGRIVQFYVEATGANGEKNVQPRLGAVRPALYVVDNDLIDTDLSSFRFVLSQYDLNAFLNGSNATYAYKFPRLSNTYKNMTLVIDETEIIYNCEIRPAGSPWHASDRQNLDNRGKWKMPADNYFRGKRKLTYDLESNEAPTYTLHNNRICRYWLYLMGHPVNEQEFVMTKENAKAAIFREVVEPVDLDMLNRHWENGSDGELYRIDDIFRFDDAYNKDQITNRFWWYGGAQYPGPGRYQTQWLKRSREAEYDYGALMNLLKTVNTGTYTQAQIERLLDPEKIFQIAAVRGYIGDWDSFTINRPKNAFFYRKPDDGRFMFFHWDSDLGFHANDPLYNGGSEFSTYLQKPYNRRLFRYYLSEMVDKFTSSSDRLTAWFDAEDASSSTYNINRNTYISFFNSRLATVNNEIQGTHNNAFNAGGPTTTTADSVTITGSAGSRVFSAALVGHPEATFRWTSDTAWEITGIRLKNGSNALRVIGLDDDGLAVAGQEKNLTITKSNNALPVVVLSTSPKSGNVSLGEVVMLNASASFDPDGGALTFTWTPPASGITSFTDNVDGTASAIFSTPGLYPFTVLVSDASSGTAQATVEVAVYGAAGFSNFNDTTLEPFWQKIDVEAYDNYPAGSYYSLAENLANLTLSVPANTAYPQLRRSLPATGDWILQTDVTLKTLQFGNFMTGLIIDLSNVRYAVGFKDGSQAAVLRLNPGGSETTLGTLSASDSSSMTVRVRRGGDTLFFEMRNANSQWQLISQQSLTVGTEALYGGPFASTASNDGSSMTVAFDYVMLINPGGVSPHRGNLLISELMYHPVGGSSLEFIELYNAGSQAIDLAGFQFLQGQPFDTYTFGARTIQPAEYLLLISNPLAFNAEYPGLGSQIIGNWTGGNLSNSGETITLVDSSGSLVAGFTYSDQAPWPLTPDGQGPSLVLIDPASKPELGLAANWRASVKNGGSPGTADGESFAQWMTSKGLSDPNADPDGNGLSNLLDYALGEDLTSGSVLPNALLLGGNAGISFRQRASDTSLVYSVEASADLINWNNDVAVYGSSVDNGDGTLTVTYQALNAGTAMYLRLRVSAP